MALTPQRQEDIYQRHRRGLLDYRAALRLLMADQTMTAWAAGEILSHRSSPLTRLRQRAGVVQQREAAPPEGPPAAGS